MTSDRSILLVEDDRFLRRAAEAALKRAGYRVRVAVDGEEALEAAAAEPWDLILLDLILPKLPGFEVLRQLKQDRSSSTPVIVLSNLGQDRDVQQAMQLGALSYLVKANLSLEDLVHRVEAALQEAGSNGKAAGH